MMRVWTCSECGDVATIGYDWLAKNGNPVCCNDDCDNYDHELDLQPEAIVTESPRGAILGLPIEPVVCEYSYGGDEVATLINTFEASGLDCEVLDELVHDLASSIAANINNGGADDQINYLVKECGYSAIRDQIEELIRSQTERKAYSNGE